MSWHRLFSLLPSRTARRTRRTRPRLTPWRFVRPRLEHLENRIAPTFSLGAAANYAILFEGSGRATLVVFAEMLAASK